MHGTPWIAGDSAARRRRTWLYASASTIALGALIVVALARSGALAGGGRTGSAGAFFLGMVALISVTFLVVVCLFVPTVLGERRDHARRTASTTWIATPGALEIVDEWPRSRGRVRRRRRTVATTELRDIVEGDDPDNPGMLVAVGTRGPARPLARIRPELADGFDARAARAALLRALGIGAA
jgi:hypothetical protein